MPNSKPIWGPPQSTPLRPIPLPVQQAAPAPKRITFQAPAACGKTTTAAQIIGQHLTRALTVEQINANRGQGRLAHFGRVRSVDAEARTVELAFSSEAPVDRWFGTEVLDHDPASIRLDRMQNGAALLLDHDWSRQIGVVESVTIGSDRVGRATVRFSRSLEAEAVLQDVIDNIRRHVSVGYAVHGYKREAEDDVEIVRVTDWEPYEISLVAVPADPSVGVGRSADDAPGTPEEITAPSAQGVRHTPAGHQQRELTMHKKIVRDAQGNLVRAMVKDDGTIVEVLEVLEQAGAGEEAVRAAAAATATSAATTAERTRVQSLQDMGRQYNAADLADAAIRDGSTAEILQGRILERLNQRGQRQRPITEAGNGGSVGLSEREISNYSFFRGIRSMLPNASAADIEAAAFERECSEAAQRTYGREARGLMVPQEVLNHRAFNAGGAANTPAGATTGANLVATNLLAGSFIDMLRNRTVFMQLAQTMTGLVGNVDIPKQTGGASAYWIGEGDDATEQTPTIGQISMTPHTLAVYSDITRRLLMQSTPDAELIVRSDLAAAMAQELNRAGIYGSGTGDEPAGLANLAGINAVEFAAAGQPTYAEIVQMESAIAADNADVPSMAYMMAATMRGTLKTTQKFTGTNGAPVWEDGNTVNGYRAEVTNQVAAGDMFFGNWADAIVGMWGGLDIMVDPYSLSKSGGLRIVQFQDVDFLFRRAESFCYGAAA